MQRAILRTLPYLALGLIGGLGLLAVTVQKSPSMAAAPAPAPPTPPVAAAGPFLLEADLGHQVIAADADSAFLRVALTGREDPGAPRLPAALTLVIDTSGSMAGDKILDAKRAAKRALEALAPGDAYRVIAFNSTVHELGAGFAGDDGVAATFAAIDGLRAVGGTDLRAALHQVRPSRDDERVARALLVSDGRPDTERGLRERVRALAADGLITTTVGVGLDYNEDLMAELADLGRGNYHFVERATDLGGVFEQELRDVSRVVARDLVVEVDAPGAEPLGLPRLDSERVAVAVGDLYAGRTVELLFRVPLRRGQEPVVAVRARAREGEQRDVARATRSADRRAVAASANAAVQVQAAKWEASQIWLQSNALYNAGRADEANRVIEEQLQTLGARSSQYGSADLAREVQELRGYLDNNVQGGARRSLNNYAKWKARGMNR